MSIATCALVAGSSLLLLPASPADAAAKSFTYHAKVSGSHSMAHSFSFTEVLRNGKGNKVGTDAFFCKATSASGGHCTGTWTFGKKGKRGTISGAGNLDFNSASGVVTITGGTKSFKHAKGTVDLTFVTDAKTTEAFHLS